MLVTPATAAAAPADLGSVSGLVVNTNGDPLSGICVNIGPSGPGGGTGVDGSYLVEGIEPGEHTVQFVDCNPTPVYVARWYRDHLFQDQADPVTVPANANVALDDVTLSTGVAVSGTVTDGSSAPLAGINVYVNPYDGPGPSGGAQTAADGSYRVGPLPDGDYRVQFDDPADVFANQYWSLHPVWSDADRLHLQIANGTERTRIDATLALAATITGTVTDSAGPLADVCVNANTPAANGGWSGIAQTTTGADGTYRLAGLPSLIDLRIQFRDCASTPSHVEQWYDRAVDFNRSTPLLLGAGQVRSGIDAVLATGIRVAGTVTSSSGVPLRDIDVYVNPDGQGPGGYGRTDGTGHYVTSALPPGRYRVQFRDNSLSPEWAGTYWDQEPTYGTADLLDLAASDAPQRDGIDAQLARGASITGTVTSAQGDPIGSICIDAVVNTSNGPDGVGQVTTAADGTYILTGLPAMAVRLRAHDCNLVGPYRTLWWPAAATYDAATPIDLATGEHRTGIDFALPAAAMIGGTVTDAVTGQPLAGICVQAVTAGAFGALAHTGGDGTYRMIIKDGGDYSVQFVDCSEQPSHAGQTRAQPISLTPGEAVGGIDAALAPGTTATVSGSIRNGDGAAVTSACAVVYLANQFAVFGQVAADGTFTVSGVPSGTFAIGFIGFIGIDCERGQPSAVVHDPLDPATTYTAQWWHGVDLSLAGSTEGGPDPIAQGATLVAIPDGGRLTGFDQCFGCAPPTTTTTTTTTTVASPTTTTTTASTPSPQLAITITGHSRGPGTITLRFTVTGVLGASDAVPDPVVYTATCTSTSASTARAQGTASPIVLTGINNRATYACVVAATENGRVLGTSVVVIVEPIPAGGLAATGASSAAAARAALVVTLCGMLLVLAGTRPRAGR